MPLVVFLMALLVRAVYVHLSYQLNLFPDLFLDSKYYEKIAALIQQGFGAGDHPYMLSPLYPYLISPFILDGGELDANMVRYIQSVAGSITCVFAALIAREILDSRAGWIAGLVMALYGPMIHYDALILVASLQTMTITLAVWLLVYSLGCPERKLLSLGAGLALGISTALRPTGLVLVVAVVLSHVVVVFFKKKSDVYSQWLKKTVLFVCGCLLVIAPFTARNYLVSGEPILLSANGGINFWIGNHKGSHGIFNLPPDYDLVRDPLGVDAASRLSGRQLDYRGASSWWRQEAISDIGEDPLRWLSLMGKKLLLFAHNSEIPQLGLNFQWYQQKTWILALLPLNGMLLLIIAMLSPLLFHQYYRAGGWSGREVWRLYWPFLFVLVYWGAISLFFVTGRYRAPVMPLIVVISSVGLVIFFRLLWRKNQSLIPLFSVVFLAALLSVGGNKLYKSDMLLPPVNLYSGTEERQRGMAFYQQGKYREAEVAYRKSLAIRDNTITRGNLANALKAQGKIDEALLEYKKVLEENPRDAIANYNLANLFRDYRGDMPAAIRHYQKALEIQPKFAEAYLNLGLLLERIGETGKAIDALQGFIENAEKNDKNREPVVKMIAELSMTISDN
jgi:tetratricopeptide (TPR) repeat protein